MNSRLRAASASALALGTRANASIASTLTSCLLSSRNMLYCLLILLQTTTALPTLQIRQAPRLGMDVSNLLVALRVEACKLLTSRRSHRFLEVRVDAPPSCSRLISDAVALIKALGAISRLVFRVELSKGVGKAIRDTMLVVEGNRTLDGGVTDHVTVSEIFCNDARTRLVFLSNVMLVAGGVFGVGTGQLANAGGA